MATPEYNTVGTDQWQILLPTDWSHKPSTSGEPGSFYFESKDGAKGAYFSVFNRSAPDVTPLTALATWRDLEITNLHAMPDHRWEILHEWAQDDHGTAISGSDCLERTRCYRILCLRLTRYPWLVRASLHDYDCSDYQTSWHYFQPIVNSFTPVAS